MFALRYVWRAGGPKRHAGQPAAVEPRCQRVSRRERAVPGGAVGENVARLNALT